MPLRPYLVQPNEVAGSLPERSDDELMRLAKAGSRGAFAVPVERHAVRVHALCSRFVGDVQLGQELAQDTWVMAWQRRDGVRTAAQRRCVPLDQRRGRDLRVV